MGENSSRKPLLEVLRGSKADRRPIWFMRQAGRYLPEYRAVRAKAGSFLNLCYNPELACEVTLQPLKRFDLDAAILFADILVVPHAMGLEVRFEEGEGPVLATVRDRADVQRLGSVEGSRVLGLICETVGLVKSRLPAGVALIGFCGGPWTVASYMIEGGSSDRVRAKIAAYGGEAWFVELIDRLVAASVGYLSMQIEAGAEAVQIFDSWAGELSGETGRRFVTEPLHRIVQALKKQHPGIPVIVFARGFGVRQREICETAGADAVGIESELPMEWAAANLSGLSVVQGNLDPVALFAPEGILRRDVEVLCGSIDRRRHIFNLGHGIRPGTDAGRIEIVVNAVRKFDS